MSLYISRRVCGAIMESDKSRKCRTEPSREWGRGRSRERDFRGETNTFAGVCLCCYYLAFLPCTEERVEDNLSSQSRCRAFLAVEARFYQASSSAFPLHLQHPTSLISLGPLSEGKRFREMCVLFARITRITTGVYRLAIYLPTRRSLAREFNPESFTTMERGSRSSLLLSALEPSFQPMRSTKNSRYGKVATWPTIVAWQLGKTEHDGPKSSFSFLLSSSSPASSSHSSSSSRTCSKGSGYTSFLAAAPTWSFLSAKLTSGATSLSY